MQSTVLALYPLPLPFIHGDETLPTIVVHFAKERCPNLPRDTDHSNGLGCVYVETNTFKQLDQDVEQRLEESWVLQLDQPTVRVESNKELAYLNSNAQTRNLFPQHLTKPFPNDGVNHHIEDPQRYRAALQDSSTSIKGFAKDPAYLAHQFSVIPKELDELLHFWVNPIAHEYLHAPIPDHGIVGLHQINEDSVMVPVPSRPAAESA